MITKATSTTGKPTQLALARCAAVWSMAMKRSLRRVGNQPASVFVYLRHG